MPRFSMPVLLAKALPATLFAAMLAAVPGHAQSLNPGGSDDGLTLGPTIPSLSPSVAPGSNAPAGAHPGTKTPAKPAAPAPFATPPEIDSGSSTPDSYQPGETAKTNAAADPIVATVDGMRIYLSDVGNFVQTLPPAERDLPYDELFPRAVNTLIGRMALVAEAYRLGLDKNPAVERQVHQATDLALQGATLSHEIAPLISESEIHARYLRDVAGKPGPVEIELGVITVATEADAKTVIAQLQGGADFAALAKQESRDPSAFNGGNLGWVRKEQMKPDIAAAALALQAGQTWPYPLHLGTGWNVIKVLGRRDAPTPSYEQMHDELRRQIILEAIGKITAKAMAGAQIQRFNMNGKPALVLGPDGLPVGGGTIP